MLAVQLVPQRKQSHEQDLMLFINHIAGFKQAACVARPEEARTCRVLLLLHGGKQLWRHPGQCTTHVAAHKGCRLFLGQPQVPDLDHRSVQIPQVTQQVVTLEVKVDHPAGVKVLHPCIRTSLNAKCEIVQRRLHLELGGTAPLPLTQQDSSKDPNYSEITQQLGSMCTAGLVWA